MVYVFPGLKFESINFKEFIVFPKNGSNMIDMFPLGDVMSLCHFFEEFYFRHDKVG